MDLNDLNKAFSEEVELAQPHIDSIIGALTVPRQITRQDLHQILLARLALLESEVQVEALRTVMLEGEKGLDEMSYLHVFLYCRHKDQEERSKRQRQDIPPTWPQRLFRRLCM